MATIIEHTRLTKRCLHMANNYIYAFLDHGLLFRQCYLTKNSKITVTSFSESEDGWLSDILLEKIEAQKA